jgi:hypothetical protein
LNACDSAPDLYPGTAQNTRTSAVSTKKKVDPALAALVEKIIAEDPYEAFGFTWAARPQKFYAEALGVHPNTIGRYIAQSPIVQNRGEC